MICARLSKPSRYIPIARAGTINLHSQLVHVTVYSPGNTSYNIDKYTITPLKKNVRSPGNTSHNIDKYTMIPSKKMSARQAEHRTILQRKIFGIRVQHGADIKILLIKFIKQKWGPDLVPPTIPDPNGSVFDNLARQRRQDRGKHPGTPVVPESRWEW